MFRPLTLLFTLVISIYTLQLPAQGVDLLSDLVAFWPFDETGGTTTDDLKASNHGTLEGYVGFVGPGIDQNALGLGGTTGRVVVPSFEINGDELTIAAWIYVAGLAGNSDEGRILSKATHTDPGGHYWMLSLKGQSLRFRLKTNGSTTTFLTGTTDFVLDQWYFVAVTYDGSNVTMYRNGSVLQSWSHSGTIDAGPGVDVGIGNQPSASAGDRAFHGAIDELGVYERALTQTEIQTLQSDGYPKSTLPVSWQKVTAQPEKAGVFLHWTVSDEQDNAGFAVERSAANGSFQRIGYLPASQGHCYSFVDPAPHAGRNFYRLRQEDHDGRHGYSPTVSVDWTDSKPPLVYPNPASSSIHVNRSGAYTLHDGTGLLLRQGTLHETDASIAVEQLPQGTYVVAFESGERVRFTKL